MPVEIRELNIRVSVNQQQPAQQQGTNSQGTAPTGNTAGKEEIIAECIEQIMDILHKQKER